MFNSKSVLLGRSGISYKLPIETPSILKNYVFAEGVVEEAIKDFNKCLDRRAQVTTNFDNIVVDILRIVPAEKSFTLWLVAEEKDIDELRKIRLTLKGEVIFAENSDTHIDKMILKNVLYADNKGILSENS